MNVCIVGGGPAGLYLALLLRRADPGGRVRVLERNDPDDTFGWGVVFSDQTLERLRSADAPTYASITDNFAHWDDIDIHFKGVTITSSGHGFSGIARQKLLHILQRRAAELGAELRFNHDVTDDAALHAGTWDLVVAADGINSALRQKYARDFKPKLDVRSARYVWLGTPLHLDAFTFAIVENENGVFQAHAYRFDEAHATWIVECDEQSWRNAGFAEADTEETIERCQEMFAPWLEGQPLLSNATHRARRPWTQFVRVSTEQWYRTPAGLPPMVLIGDAAHTAHFSIGSGTKLAMEDAIALAERLTEPGVPIAAALEKYQLERQTEALRLQNAARNSMEWFENVRRYVRLEPMQFAYSLLTRSQRVSHENLRLRDRAYLEDVERWFAAAPSARAAIVAGARAESEDDARVRGVPPTQNIAAGAGQLHGDSGQPASAPIPPMFTPFRVRGMVVPNRVVVSPMDMYSAEDGTPNDFHLVHLGERALGGAGLVFTEMTCVSPEARISLGCTGMYTPAHVAAWQRIVGFVHGNSAAKICLQLGHSGRKGATKRMWEGMDEPLDDGGWDVIGPSAIPWSERNPVPRVMTRADMAQVRDEFVAATSMAAEADFDMIEVHCAHGYLLSSFITPLSNQRTDEYGGTLENRLRYPLEVFTAMRAVWPADRPISVRISATDWADGGISPDDAVAIARAFGDAGADLIHVSAGQTSTAARPVYGRMFQTPLSDRIRNEAGVATIAVGNITEPDQVNAIIAAGRADLCALGRPHLTDPHWTLRAAAELGYTAQWWPPQYRSGKQQIERLEARKREGL